MLRPAIFSVLLLLVGASIATAGLINSSLEYGQAANSWSDHSDASINPSGGWFTTESDHQIEIWGNGYMGVNAYDGANFAELNANAVGTLYQTATGIGSGDLVDYHFAHRGRQGVDTMELKITDTTTGAILFDHQYSDGNQAWSFYSGSFTVGPNVASTDSIKFAYESISAAGGNPTIGNFLDNADFGIGANSSLPSAVPEPSSFALLGLGILGLAISAYRRRKMATPILALRVCVQMGCGFSSVLQEPSFSILFLRMTTSIGFGFNEFTHLSQTSHVVESGGRCLNNAIFYLFPDFPCCRFRVPV